MRRLVHMSQRRYREVSGVVDTVRTCGDLSKVCCICGLEIEPGAKREDEHFKANLPNNVGL